jgi:Ca2+-binding RTX toxin-like protein
MATVNAGNAGPVDMTNLQIGSLQGAGDPVYNANLVRVDAGNGHWDDITGSGFTYMMGDPYYGYGGNYDPASGTMTGLTEFSNNAVTMDVSGLAISAPNFFAMLRAGDVAGMMNALFGGDDVINGSGGPDILDGLTGNDTIVSADGDDRIRGLDGNDSIDAGAGNDDANGNQGADTVHGGDGADFVRGGQGNDLVFGDAGDDPHVNGNIGDDIVHGGDGNDTVFGGQGNDQIFGDAGDDQLSGDLGDDTMTGGPGADRFMFRAGSGHDTVADFNPAEGDRIVLPTGTAFNVVDVGGQAVLDLGGGDQLTLAGVTPASFNSGWVVFA